VLIARAMLAAHQTPADMIRAVASSGYRDYLEAEYPDARDRLDDIEQLALFAEQYTNVQALLDDVSLTSEYGAVEEKTDHEEEGKLVLSTIHQAKGLEWDAVFVMHVCDGQFPNPRALEEDGGLEEERRLFYVAITRARKYLFLSYPVSAGYDRFSVGGPSIFLQELPRGILEEVRVRSAWQKAGVAVWQSDEEATIVLDAEGERTKTSPARSSFLRSTEDL
jgi:DNA helicase-2/ATP-dependent DNA helicase PcrA